MQTAQKSKPLSSTEHRANADRLEALLPTLLHDKAKWMEARRELDYEHAATEAAEQREAEERWQEIRRQREAMRPQAEAAIRAATLEHALTDEIADVRKAIELLAGVHHRVHAKLPEIQAAQSEAVRICAESHIAFVAHHITMQDVRELFAPVVRQVIEEAKPTGDAVLYSVSISGHGAVHR